MPRPRTAAVELQVSPGMTAVVIGADPGIGRRRAPTMAATTALGPAQAAAGAPTSQLVAVVTVERADRARPSLAAGRRIELRATSGPTGGGRVARGELKTRIGHLGLVVTVDSVQAASSNVRDGPATQVVPVTEIGARVTVVTVRTVQAASSNVREGPATQVVPVTEIGARVTVMGARVSVTGARVSVKAAQATAVDARVTVMGAQATAVRARVSAMAAQATAIGEQARRVLSAHSVAERMPSDREAARARVHLRPGSPVTTGRRDNQRAASVRPIVTVTSGGRRTRRAADDRGPIRPLLPIARSGRTCLRASLLTS